MWCVCFDKEWIRCGGSHFQWQSLVIPLNIDCIGDYELLEEGNQAYGSGIGE